MGRWSGVTFQILNGTEGENRYSTISIRLEFNNGMLGYVMSVDEVGGFTRAGTNNGFSLAHWSWNNGPVGPLRPADIREGIGMTGTGIVDYSDRITLRFTATRDNPSQNAWTVRFEIINQDTAETIVDMVENAAVASSSILNGNAFWNNSEGFPWPDVLNRQPALSIDFSEDPIEEQSLYSGILDSDKDGLTDQFEAQNALAVNDSSDGTADSDNDGLTNQQEQLLGTDPRKADSDGDTIPDNWESIYGSDPNDVYSEPFGYTAAPASSFEDFDGSGLSDVWEWVTYSLPPLGDEDLDGFSNDKETSWGTDPWNPQSTPEFFLMQNGSEIELRWPELLYKNYDFQHSTDLDEWVALNGSLNNHQRSTSVNLNSENPARSFFRLNLKGNLPHGFSDSDADGVGSWAEALFGLSPIDQQSSRTNAWIDSNDDGVPDTEEFGDSYQLKALLNDGMYPGSEISDLHASRFLAQATFGPTTEDITYLKTIGLESWLDEQIYGLAPTHLKDVLLSFYQDYHGPRVRSDYYFFDDNQILPMDNMRTAFGRAVLQGKDQLRQRIAFALSQILVISGQDANLDGMPVSVANYYDTLIDNAFGNYYDILEYVTFNACMGLYLSHVGNQKAQPELNIFPDENYARELMQLFTIGLWELNPDGSRKLDANNEPIPSYGQSEITELARVMTGFWFAGREFGEGGWTDRIGLKAMEMHADKHDFGSKTIVGGHVIPSREATTNNAYQDVKDAVRLIFEHPNTPVFVSKQLIQFLVTDNPSPAYIERIQNSFVDDGQGKRGNLGAVVRAILLDPEARSPLVFTKKTTSGFLKEPVIRLMHLGRVFNVADRPDFQMWQINELEEEFYQDPLNAPSVFNFFKPHYEPAGLLGDQGLVGPTFQILHSYSAISGPQQLWNFLQRGFSTQWNNDAIQPFDYSEFLPIEGNANALLERVNILFCQGMMSRGSRTAIQEALAKLDNLEDLPPGVKTQVAVWVAITGASGATQL